MSECQLSQQTDGRWKCSVCGRIHAVACRANCKGVPVTPEPSTIPCHTCPHVRRETPFAISCLELDGKVSCTHERIGRHQARLLDPTWTCTIAR
jgi:hypothetical protein